MGKTEFRVFNLFNHAKWIQVAYSSVCTVRHVYLEPGCMSNLKGLLKYVWSVFCSPAFNLPTCLLLQITTPRKSTRVSPQSRRPAMMPCRVRWVGLDIIIEAKQIDPPYSRYIIFPEKTMMQVTFYLSLYFPLFSGSRGWRVWCAKAKEAEEVDCKDRLHHQSKRLCSYAVHTDGWQHNGSY